SLRCGERTVVLRRRSQYACHAIARTMRPQPLIAVSDVEASNRWYQRLLGCESEHGGAEYERLGSKGVLGLQVQPFDVEHHHGHRRSDRQTLWQTGSCYGLRSMTSMEPYPALWRCRRTSSCRAIETRLPAGANHWECWLRDPDGYAVVLASPDG